MKSLFRRHGRGVSSSNLAAGKVRGELFYGWVTAIAGAGVLFAVGNFPFTFGVLVPPLIDRFGWSRVTISSIIAIRGLILALIFPIAGSLSDRYPTKRLILGGVLLGGLGYLLLFRATSLWHFYLFFSLLTAISQSFLFIPIQATVNRWFGGKSTLANGVTLAGFSAGQIFFPPLVTYLIGRYGWETSLIILGVVVWLLGMLFWNFLKSPPARFSPQVPGSAKVAGGDETGPPLIPAGDQYSRAEVLRTTSFRLLFLVYMINATCFFTVVVHIVAAAIGEGIAPGEAAVILTIIGGTSMLGRLGVGGLADKIGRRKILTISLALQVPALFLLAGATNLVAFYIAGAIYGLFFGAVMPIIPTLAGSFFGMKSVGAILGTLNIAHVLGGVFGPLMAGYIFDVTGSYYIAFVLVAIAVAVAFVLSLPLRPPPKRIS